MTILHYSSHYIHSSIQPLPPSQHKSLVPAPECLELGQTGVGAGEGERRV